MRRGANSYDATDTPQTDSASPLALPPSVVQRPQRRYDRSEAERALEARRMTAEAEIADPHMREVISRSSSEVRKMATDTGGPVIYKPDSGERYVYWLDFEYRRGSMNAREIAAFRVSELLGFGRVPTTVRTGGDDIVGPDGERSGPGMIQEFIESTRNRPVEAYPLAQQHQVAVLDYIIGAMDRHPGNWRTVDRGEYLDIVAIDHGRSFPENPDALNVELDSDFLHVHKGEPLETGVLDAVRAVEIDRLRAALEDAGLSRGAVDGAVTRLEKIRELGHIPANVKFLERTADDAAL
ncbi:hypothetical protein ACWCPQ_19275 [Nocardia sp. NPDC001965]